MFAEQILNKDCFLLNKVSENILVQIENRRLKEMSLSGNLSM